MTAARRLALAALALSVPLSLGAPALRAQDTPPTGGAQSAPQNGQGMRGQGRMGMGRGVRGTVTAASGANVTLKTEQGETWTVVTTDNTRVMIDRQPVKVAELKAGDEVVAAGVMDQDKHEIHAMMVMGASAAAAAKLKADMGKTYIVGKVTAINDTKLTIERTDKVSQTILLDDSTSLQRGGRMPAELMSSMMMGGGGPRGGGARAGGFRSGAGDTGTNNANSGGMPPGAEGEAITLADIKVGDSVAGSGSIKGGTFVPSELHVLVRLQRGPGRAGAPGEGGAAPQQ